MNKPNNPEFAIINEFAEIEARANYYMSAPADFLSKYGVKAIRVGSFWVMMIAGLNLEFFNRIVGLGVREEVTPMMLDDAIAIMQKTGNKNYLVQICPYAQPASIHEWLLARGFIRGRNQAKFWRDNAAPQVCPCDLCIELIGAESATAYADIIITVFNMSAELHPLMKGPVGKPGWRHYLAYAGKQPVAAGALFIKNDIGWLGFGSTIESQRRHGAQGALIAQRLQDGIALGCRWFVSETAAASPDKPSQSYQNMLHGGFDLAYLRPEYVFRQKQA
jgi:hypothetical protein